MNILLTAGTGLSQIACSAEECLSWIIILLNILTVFYLVFCAWFKITKTVKIIGYVWASALLVGSIAVIAVHTCIFTILSGVFTGLILMAVLSVVFNGSNIFAKKEEGEKEEKTKKTAGGAYVIHKTDDGKYVFLLYNARRVFLSKSVYKYDTVEEAKKAIAVCRENGSVASVENKTKSWIEFVNLPKFVVCREDGKIRFSLNLSDETVIITSELFTESELCEKKLRETLGAVKSEKLYYSEREVIAGHLFMLLGATEERKAFEEPQQGPETVEKNFPAEEEEIVAAEEGPEANDEEEIVYVEDEQGNHFRIRYNKSFRAKLMQASDETKRYYTELKNEALSYYKTRSRVSWSFDSVSTGRTPLIKFGVRGKTLCVYYALNAEDYADSKYKVEQAKAARYETVPCMYRIKNKRRLKFAKKLIADVCKKSQLTKGEVPTVDYGVPYATTAALLKKGMIKEIKVGIK